MNLGQIIIQNHSLILPFSITKHFQLQVITVQNHLQVTKTSFVRKMIKSFRIQIVGLQINFMHVQNRLSNAGRQHFKIPNPPKSNLQVQHIETQIHTQDISSKAPSGLSKSNTQNTSLKPNYPHLNQHSLYTTSLRSHKGRRV